MRDDLSVRAGSARAVRDRFEQYARRAALLGRVDELQRRTVARARARPELRDHGHGREALAVGHLACSAQRDWQEISVGIPFRIVDAHEDERHAAIGVADRHRVHHAQRRHRSFAPREPSTRLEESRQRVFQERALFAVEERVDARAVQRRGLEERRARVLVRRARRLEREPIERVRAEREEIRNVADLRKLGAPKELVWHLPFELREIELHKLHEARQVRDDEDRLVAMLPDEREDARVVRAEKLDRPAAERLVTLAERDDALHPPEERVRVVVLRFDVERLVVVLGIDDDRQDETLRIRARETGVPVGAPLHRRAHAVAIAEVDVVAHPDLVAVIEDRRPRERGAARSRAPSCDGRCRRAARGDAGCRG